MFSDVPHTHQRTWGLRQRPARASLPSEHLLCVLDLQESCVLAKTSFILISSFWRKRLCSPPTQ